MRAHRWVAWVAAVVILGAGCDGDGESASPDTGAAEVGQSDAEAPDAGTPDTVAPDTVAPDAVAPDAAAPADVPLDAAPTPDADHDTTDDASDTAEWSPPPLAATVARYDLAARPAVMPFPYDRYLVADETSRTGQRVRIDDESYSNSQFTAVFTYAPAYREALRTFDGFGAYAWASLEMSDALPDGWTQAPDDALPADAPVQMFQWDGATVTRPLPFWARALESADRAGRRHHYLDALPHRPLPDGGRYLIAVTRDLRDANDEPVGPDAHFQVVAGLHPLPPDPALRAELEAERARLAPALDALEAAGLPRERLVVAFDVTVGPLRADLLDIATRFRADEELRQVAYTFDPDGDGTPNVYRPGDPGFPGLSDVAVYVEGRFERRDFRDPDYHGGAFVLDEEGRPLLDHREMLSFYFALPTAAADGPVPVCILLHGINSRKEHVRSLVSPLAAAGMAVFAPDLPKHGEDGGGAIPFLNIPQPMAGRDNFRQAAVDILTERYLLAQWAAEGLDLVPAGGDGAPDLEAERIVLVGNSLGAMTGSMGMALDQQPEAGVLAVGGGGVFYFVRSFLEEYGLAALLDDCTVHGVELLGGQVYGAGDPVIYTSLLRPELPEWVERPHQVMMMEVIGDRTMPEDCLEASACNMELPLVPPVAKPVFGLDECGEAAPSAGIVQYEGEGASHELLFGGGPTARARAQLVHFLARFLADGQAEILHPYPMD